MQSEPERVEIAGQLKRAIIYNSLIVIVQIAGGVISNSLGLLSDAAHNFTDTAALALSFFAILQTLKPPSPVRTFGHHRSAILAAFLNSVFLILLTCGIFYSAYQRIRHPEVINGLVMYTIAIFAFIGNTGIALLFQKSRRSEINAKLAFIHMAGDALVSLGVIIAGIVITYTHWYLLDPIISVIIGLVIAIGTFDILKETYNILMEGAPKEIPVEKVRETILSVPTVREILDLHLWTIGNDCHILSCQILIGNMTMTEGRGVREAIRKILAKKHTIDHLTIELEVETNWPGSAGCELFQKKAV
jgi:cobalt-zinc-cadmium efflux system protein